MRALLLVLVACAPKPSPIPSSPPSTPSVTIDAGAPPDAVAIEAPALDAAPPVTIADCRARVEQIRTRLRLARGSRPYVPNAASVEVLRDHIGVVVARSSVVVGVHSEGEAIAVLKRGGHAEITVDVHDSGKTLAQIRPFLDKLAALGKLYLLGARVVPVETILDVPDVPAWAREAVKKPTPDIVEKAITTCTAWPAVIAKLRKEGDKNEMVPDAYAELVADCHCTGIDVPAFEYLSAVMNIRNEHRPRAVYEVYDPAVAAKATDWTNLKLPLR